MFGLGIGEIAIILFVALIFIGPKKLPELARGLGKGIAEFQNAAKGLQETIKNPPASKEENQPLDQPDDHSHNAPLDQPEVKSSSKSES